jgi:hypothetical protein
MPCGLSSILERTVLLLIERVELLSISKQSSPDKVEVVLRQVLSLFDAWHTRLARNPLGALLWAVLLPAVKSLRKIAGAYGDSQIELAFYLSMSNSLEDPNLAIQRKSRDISWPAGCSVGIVLADPDKKIMEKPCPWNFLPFSIVVLLEKEFKLRNSPQEGSII